MGVDSLLSGIIVNTGLYSVNIAIMEGASSVSLNKTDTVFTLLRGLLGETPLAGQYKLLTALLAAGVMGALLSLFLGTRLGLAIRATGDNPGMVRSSSINTTFTTTVGLCLSNALTGLSGCLMAQYQKYAEINIGTGMLSIALASLLIGRTLLGKGTIPRRAVGMAVGAILFQLVYTAALRLDMPGFMLKLVSAVIVALAISGPYLKNQWPIWRRRMAQGKEGR